MSKAKRNRVPETADPRQDGITARLLSVFELAAISGHKTLQMVHKYAHMTASTLAQKLG